MEILKKEKDKLRLEYEHGEPVMKMETRRVDMTFHFAEIPPPLDVKQAVVDILTSQYTGKVSE